MKEVYPMTTLWIDADRYKTARELHAALKMLLGLPDYYGMNADALHDCLSERSEPVRLWIASPGEGEVSRSLAGICAVVEDLGGEIVEI